MELQNSSSGFDIGYNSSYGSVATETNALVSWTFADNHGPHDMMNLWEGNVGEIFGSDGYFGGSSHATAFRNHFTAFNRNSGTSDEPVRLNRLSYHYNIVGNVLGSSSWAAGKYNQTWNNCYGGTGVYRLGYPNIGNCSLTDVRDEGGGYGDSSGHVGRIPAQQCWDNRNLLARGAFSSAACYAQSPSPVPKPPTNVRVES